MRQVNRWVWGVSGVATMVVLAIPGTRIFTHGNLGTTNHGTNGVAASATATLPSLSGGFVAETCGAFVQVTAQPVHQIQVTEIGNYPPGQGIKPSVSWSLSGKQVILGDQGCNAAFNPVNYSVIVPDGTAVIADSAGGNVTISGTAQTDVDSGSGFVTVRDIAGPLTVDSQGGNVTVDGAVATTVDSGSGFVDATGIRGSLTVDSQGGNVNVTGLTGPLNANTGSGFLEADDLNTAYASVTTGGGNARMVFATPPQTVSLSTDSGFADLNVPGGAYALTASTDSGSESVQIATNPQASRSITVSTGGGNLLVAP
jgi:hypothetical protein